jgi:signal transduction histidine kinase/DNA-binding response OmpR family regulator/ligand-binding sensor domain-containing protein
MWIGTADGLNMYNGTTIRVLKPEIDLSGSLVGNLIEEVWEGEEDIIWVNTNHGVNRFNKKTLKIDSFKEFEGKYYCAKTKDNDFFVIHESKRIHYYNKKQNSFIPVPYPEIEISDLQRIFIDNENVLWMSYKDTVLTILISLDSDEIPKFQAINKFTHNCKIRHIFREKESVYFIDSAFSLFEMNTETCRKSFIFNIRKEIEERGVVSSIIKDNDDYLIAFQTNGVFRLQHTPESAIKFEVKNIEIYCGVFCLLKDEKQDIIWIGTDGQGLYAYTRDMVSIRSVTFENLHFAIQKPVRALFLDKMNNLWIGTKDDGMILIDNYDIDGSINTKTIIHKTVFNSNLVNNNVYAFSGSSRNLLWIGGDGPGLNYYSYRDRTIRRVPSPTGEPVVFIHNIIEANDSTLWLSSVGAGIYKIIIGGSANEPFIKSVKRFTFIKDEMSYNFFFTACRENDSIIWFGNRGYGLQRLNLNTEKFDNILFKRDDIRTINDILSLHKDRDGNIWVGTGFGVVRILDYNPATKDCHYMDFSDIEGFPNTTIHGIQQDNEGFLWISTNTGLVRFSPETEKFRLYNSANGLNVFEFSDGADFCDSITGTLYFGGINGFLSVSPDMYKPKEFVPEISFIGLKIFEKEYNINDFTQSKNGSSYLQLRHDQNFFSVSYAAPDYINGSNAKYYYNLEGFNNIWIDNGPSTSVNFTSVTPGTYTIHVRCDNGDVTTKVYSLPVVILPPWYRTFWAYTFYFALMSAMLWWIVRSAEQRNRRKRETIIEKMHQQQKEEIYESKLRFFTNITHEFLTPLTLIYGPCARIVDYDKSDSFIKRYAGMIMKNTERLCSLIQELIEFRRIETGHKECVFAQIDIYGLCSDIFDSFSDLAENNNIDFQINIEENIFWNTDKSCFTKILSNLLSNAFKYSPNGGRIAVEVTQGKELLSIRVSNTGKGIAEKDIPHIFDRYRVIENIEKQSNKSFFSRNGLGLAITHNMVKLLDGDINVVSIPNGITEFQVILPQKEITARTAVKTVETGEFKTIVPLEQTRKPVIKPKTGQLKHTVLVVDDDPEMCWFISDVMSEKYNVISIENPLNVRSILESVNPQLIVSDIMMPGIDGISLMKQIKSDRHTAHIPFILLSAKNTPEEQTEGVNAGAEAYVVKPFNVQYLISLADRLLQRQTYLKDYYRSPISAFELTEGKLLHKDQKIFFERVLQVIDYRKNDADFSTEQLAEEIGVSPRHLYRKLQEITQQTPADLIKSYKLAVVAKLLVTTKNSIDEIMFTTGFNSRGSFYKLFSKKYGMTPKQYREEKSEKVRTEEK